MPDVETRPPRRFPAWMPTALAVVVLVIAAVLRFYSLGRSSFWIDEASSVALVSMPWRKFLHTLWTYEANMTLYYLLLRAWMHMGTSEAMLRALSALFGVAGVGALYVLGRRLVAPKAALLAAALLAVNVLHIQTSQDTRAYTLVVLLVILSTHAFVNAVEAPERTRGWVIYVALSVLSVYAHLFAVLVIGAQWLAAGTGRLRRIGARRVMAIAAGLGLPLVPLGLFVLLHDHGQLDWIRSLYSAGFVFSTFLLLNGANPLLAIVLIVALVRAALALRQDDEGSWTARLLAIWFLFPIVLVILVSIVKPVFFIRYFAICIPAAMLLAAAELTRPLAASRWRIGLRVAVVTMTVAVSSLVTLGYFRGWHDWAGDWRGATEHILAEADSGDAVVFDVTAGFDAFRYYRERVPSGVRGVSPTVVFPTADELASAHIPATPERLRAAVTPYRRVWVVQNCRPMGAAPLDEKTLGAYHSTGHKIFGGSQPEMGVDVSLFEKN
jgi:mannosyltransferase